MICFILYTTYDLEHYGTYINVDRQNESSVLRIMLYIFVAYFGINEFRQALISGFWQYF
jgi:hypothetical protein